MKSTVFWGVTLCSLVDRYERFEAINCLLLHGVISQKTVLFITTAVITPYPLY
jgi:hypothetical protein